MSTLSVLHPVVQAAFTVATRTLVDLSLRQAHSYSTTTLHATWPHLPKRP
jgi:hypothetical protein